MNLRFPLLSTAVAVISGLVVLFLYFFPVFAAGVDWRSTLLQWAASLSAVALVIGLFNLAAVHSRKLEAEGAAPLYSGTLLLAMLVSFVLVLTFGPASAPAIFLLNYIQIPVEGSLIAVLAVTLVLASARLIRRKMTPFSAIFLATALLMVFLSSPLVTDFFPDLGENLKTLYLWLVNVPATAGARGILLGIALGTIATGLRILIGADRPYGG